MSVVPASVRCDICAKDRVSDSNHWISFLPEKFSGGKATSIIMLEGILQGNPYAHHACGETCALKLVSRWLSTGKLDE